MIYKELVKPNNFRKERKKKGWSIHSVAYHMNCNESEMCKVERGERPVNLPMAIVAEELYEKSIDKLVPQVKELRERARESKKSLSERFSKRKPHDEIHEGKVLSN